MWSLRTTRQFASKMSPASSLTGVNTKVLKNGDPAPPAPAPETFRIYNMRFCPWAQRALIYAAVHNIPTEVVNIHLKEKPEWYFSKHFKGQVPTLEHDEGRKVVIESAVIPEYLDDLFPATRVLPTDPYQKALQKLLLERLVAVAPAFYGLIAAAKDPKLKEEKYAALAKAVEEAEKLLTAEYFSGTSKPGYVDYLIFPNLQRVQWASHILTDLPISSTGFPGPQYPKLSAWYQKIDNHPAVQAASQPTELGVQFFKEVMTGGTPNYDYGL